MSESSKYRHLIEQHCAGCGVDIGSQGAAIVPWGISFDLPEPEFSKYSGGTPPSGPIHLRGDCRKLPFESGSLDWLLSSHLIEDFDIVAWPDIFAEWARVLRPGGYMIILAPERHAWEAYLANGGPPNVAHRHEPLIGEISALAKVLGLNVITERMTECHPGDYSLLCVLQR